MTTIDVRKFMDIYGLGEILKRHGINTPSNALVIDLMKWREA